MSHIFGLDVDFNYNQTLKQVIENQITFPTLTASEAGFVFYHTANQKFYGWDGSSWLDFTATGGGGGGSFLDLSDTPVDYTGQAGLVPYVNPGETALEFKGFVDKTSTENVGGLKTFTSPLHIGDQIIYNTDGSPTGYASGGASGYLGASSYYFWKDAGGSVYGALDFDALTATRTYDWPDKDGTVAMLSDVGQLNLSANLRYNSTNWKIDSTSPVADLTGVTWDREVIIVNVTGTGYVMLIDWRTSLPSWNLEHKDIWLEPGSRIHCSIVYDFTGGLAVGPVEDANFAINTGELTPFTGQDSNYRAFDLEGTLQLGQAAPINRASATRIYFHGMGVYDASLLGFDTTGLVTTDTTQTISATKTFTANQNFNANLSVNVGTYEYDMFPSGMRLNNTGAASPNDGAWGWRYFSGKWDMIGPIGTAGTSGSKLVVENNDNIGNTALTAISIPGQLEVVDEAYNATNWNGSLQVPTKNAVRDQFEALVSTGTFTPVLSDTGGGATYSPTTADGVYQKIGNYVYYTIVFATVTVTGTPSGDMRITNASLPFAPVNTEWPVTVGRMNVSGTNYTAGDPISASIFGTGDIRFYKDGNTTLNAFSSIGTMVLQGFYEAS